MDVARPRLGEARPRAERDDLDVESLEEDMTQGSLWITPLYGH